MMSLKSKRELLEVVQPRYLKANKTEKQKIFDEFTSVTGYHRKHAIRALKNQVQVQNHPKMRFCRLREKSTREVRRTFRTPSFPNILQRLAPT